MLARPRASTQAVPYLSRTTPVEAASMLPEWWAITETYTFGSAVMTGNGSRRTPASPIIENMQREPDGRSGSVSRAIRPFNKCPTEQPLPFRPTNRLRRYLSPITCWNRGSRLPTPNSTSWSVGRFSAGRISVGRISRGADLSGANLGAANLSGSNPVRGDTQESGCSPGAYFDLSS